MKKMNVQPLGENVLIAPEKPEKKTEAGIYLPDTASQDRSQIGTIMGVGESEKIQVKKGQKVIFKLYGGEEVTIEGEKYLLCNYKDVLAVIS